MWSTTFCLPTGKKQVPTISQSNHTILYFRSYLFHFHMVMTYYSFVSYLFIIACVCLSWNTGRTSGEWNILRLNWKKNHIHVLSNGYIWLFMKNIFRFWLFRWHLNAVWFALLMSDRLTQTLTAAVTSSSIWTVMKWSRASQKQGNLEIHAICDKTNNTLLAYLMCHKLLNWTCHTQFSIFYFVQFRRFYTHSI